MEKYHQYLDEQCLDAEPLTKCFACGEEVLPEQVIKYQDQSLCSNCYDSEMGYKPTDEERLAWIGK